MKDTYYKPMEYESPSMTYSSLEFGGLICSSELSVQTDRWDSTDAGVVELNDDAIYLPDPTN